MTHGWPELSISWRHQLLYLGDKGYRAVAPDMRGYGGSSIYAEHSASLLLLVCASPLDFQGGRKTSNTRSIANYIQPMNIQRVNGTINFFTTRTSIKHKKKWKRTQSGWRNSSSEKATQMDKDR